MDFLRRGAGALRQPGGFLGANDGRHAAWIHSSIHRGTLPAWGSTGTPSHAPSRLVDVEVEVAGHCFFPVAMIFLTVAAKFTVVGHSENVARMLSLALPLNVGTVFAATTSALVAFVVGYCTAIALHCRHEQARIVVFAAFVLTLAGLSSYWQVHRSSAQPLAEKRTSAVVILQSSDFSCAAAALANIAAHFGRVTSVCDAAAWSVSWTAALRAAGFGSRVRGVERSNGKSFASRRSSVPLC